MRSFLTLFGAVLLVVISVTLGALLLPSCGVLNSVAGTWIDWCPENTRNENETRLAAISERNSQLLESILEKEREIALLQCLREPEVAEVPELPRQTEPEIDRDGWMNREIASLEGCWNLESKFSTTDRRTGLTSRYTSWRMCFDANGVGREEMRAENGSTCSGPVQGRFGADGALEIEQPSNLQCSDGGFIYRLSSRCELDAGSGARCLITQPELGRSTNVEFGRALRNE